MSGAMITVDIDDQATRLYAGIAARLGKSKGLMDSIGQQLVSGTLKRFQTQTGPDGKKWASLSKATLKKRGTNAKALQASGRLRQSITFRSTSTSVEVGTNVIYAALQQLGGTIDQAAHSTPIFRRQKDMEAGKSRFVKEGQSDFKSYHLVEAHSFMVPGRPFIGVSASDQAAIEGLAHYYVMGAAS